LGLTLDINQLLGGITAAFPDLVQLRKDRPDGCF
jgi:hypothetical protein